MFRALFHWSIPVVFLLAACGPKEAPDPRPNWYRDVEPLVEQHCAGCHTQGGVTPFTLLSYDDFKAHATEIRAAVASKTMPPWMPTNDCNTYQNDRQLTADQIATLTGFIDDGLLLGNPKDEKKVDVTVPGLTSVDLTLDPGVDYTPNSYATDPTRLDDYRCFILDPMLTGPRDLIGFQVTPGQLHEVHHVLVYSVDAASAQALDDAEPGPGWTCFGGPKAKSPSLMGAWAPGMPPTRYPNQTGPTMYGGSVLVMQVHYNLSNGPATPDRTKVALQFAPVPVMWHAQMFPVLDDGFDIPPHTTGYTSGASFDLPIDANVWGIAPHMHVKGVDIRVDVTHADGSNTCLVEIPKWNFQWQQFYFFSAHAGVPLKQGDKLNIKCKWDNPTDAPVTWGEGTADEMCLGFLYLTSPL